MHTTDHKCSNWLSKKKFYRLLRYTDFVVETLMDQLLPNDLTREQRRHLEDVRELWEAWAPLTKRRDELVGSMAWKTVKDRQYLVRYWHSGDTGDKKMTSLGPRSPETEEAKLKFERDRVEVDAALAKFRPRLDGLARVGRALRVGRLETAAADVLREVWKADLLGTGLTVVGSSAIHLYEASASVLVPQAIVPSGDLDLMVLHRSGADVDDLARILRRADRTFRPVRDLSFANADGFRVDVLPLDRMRSFYSGLGDLTSEQHRVLDEAVDLPPVQAVGVARDGLPVPMAGLDPRSFALLKFVRAEFDQDRSRNAAEIDRDQAFAVGAIVANYWRQEFEPEWLEAFPGLAEQIGAESPEDRGSTLLGRPFTTAPLSKV